MTGEFHGIASEIDAYKAQRAPEETDARIRLQGQRDNMADQLRRVAELMRDELRKPETTGHGS
jgi:hypothetical protein